MTNLKGNIFNMDLFRNNRSNILSSLYGIFLGVFTLVLFHSHIGYGFYNESKPVNLQVIDQFEKYIVLQTKLDNKITFEKSNYALENSYQQLNIPIKEKSVKVTMASRSSLQLEDYVRLNLTKPSNLTSDIIDQFLSGTNLDGLGKAFIDAENKYHVNAEYLMAHAIHESDWGKSKIAIDKKNLFGLKAYDKNPYKYAKGFSTYEESIDYTAKYISENYLSISGKYYNGPTLLGMNKMYATSKEWAYDIASIMRYFDKKVSV